MKLILLSVQDGWQQEWICKPAAKNQRASGVTVIIIPFCACEQTIWKYHRLISISWTLTRLLSQAQFYNKLMPAVFNSLQVLILISYLYAIYLPCWLCVKHCKFWWQVCIQHQDMDEQRVKCIQTFMRKSAQTEQVYWFATYVSHPVNLVFPGSWIELSVKNLFRTCFQS